ncbi:GNAT family N-acetyltransferase [Shewanella sp. AS1]|uniref:GNAT family N-acetyltransferase n=1 Tax=Shewanella sp. AS1 TaxID=2907626 RepID=UPI001F19CE24|nr:GNAT family N-acetyltransferase [Shewanella sp. AS1]MCE9677885.1 GNAT family N-acetyltransferase [Shewanella sp. AS1]
MTALSIRPIHSNDWPAILKIQAQCYPDIVPESQVALQSKVAISPDSCFVLEVGQQVLGYCLAHPWVLNQPPSLEQVVRKPTAPDSLYLHDIAISAQARGLGAAEQIFNRLVSKANQLGFASISLVAVQGADRYWQRLGFKSRIIDKKLNNYPDDACYMVYSIGD